MRDYIVYRNEVHQVHLVSVSYIIYAQRAVLINRRLPGRLATINHDVDACYILGGL